jgi:hypothetical protein
LDNPEIRPFGTLSSPRLLIFEHSPGVMTAVGPYKLQSLLYLPAVPKTLDVAIPVKPYYRLVPNFLVETLSALSFFFFPSSVMVVE